MDSQPKTGQFLSPLSPLLLFQTVAIYWLLQGNTFAGTTFVNGTSSYAGSNVFSCISSNGNVIPINIDQSAFAAYGQQEGMAVDTNGNLFVAYSGDAIVEFTTNTAKLFVTNIGAPSFLCFDGAGNLYGLSNNCVYRITTNGTALFASGISGLNSFCFDAAGNMYASTGNEWASTGNQILQLTPQGATNVFANINSLNLGFQYPTQASYSLALDSQTNIYAGIAVYQGYSYYFVCRFTPNGTTNALYKIGGQQGTGPNILVDENSNVISTAIFYPDLGFGVIGPFGEVDFPPKAWTPAPYIAYTPVNEVLGIYSPSFGIQPLSQTIAAGTTVYFYSSAVGSLPISYQWFFNQTNAIPGATNQSLTLTNVTENQTGQYSVVASNYLGTATSSAAGLNVIPALAITTVPALSLYGGIGYTYSVQYINQYGPTNAPWTTLATVVLTNSPQFYPDYSAIGQPARFYRTIQLP